MVPAAVDLLSGSLVEPGFYIALMLLEFFTRIAPDENTCGTEQTVYNNADRSRVHVCDGSGRHALRGTGRSWDKEALGCLKLS
jgi:hypothetical protein